MACKTIIIGGTVARLACAVTRRAAGLRVIFADGTMLIAGGHTFALFGELPFIITSQTESARARQTSGAASKNYIFINEK